MNRHRIKEPRSHVGCKTLKIGRINYIIFLPPIIGYNLRTFESLCIIEFALIHNKL